MISVSETYVCEKVQFTVDSKGASFIKATQVACECFFDVPDIQELSILLHQLSSHLLSRIRAIYLKQVLCGCKGQSFYFFSYVDFLAHRVMEVKSFFNRYSKRRLVVFE